MEDITVDVKFGGRTISLSVSPDVTVKAVKLLLQPLTDVLPRGQKLIFKGKVLSDGNTLRLSQVSNGSKIMLMASQGLHQGVIFFPYFIINLTTCQRGVGSEIIQCPLIFTILAGPILKEASTRSIPRAAAEGKRTEIPINKGRSERWKLTGVIALSQANLKLYLLLAPKVNDSFSFLIDLSRINTQCQVIPNEVWPCGASTRVLDLGNNNIRDIPSKIGTFCSIQSLLLNANDIVDGSISWEGLSLLKSLTHLSLSGNHLTVLPPELGSLTSLKQLDVANNKLGSLPSDIEFLKKLEVLNVSSNRITIVPVSIGSCNSLTEIDLSSNLLKKLPETIGNLQHLKALHLSNNGLETLPSALFKMCLQLSTLDLHNTEITMDVLCDFEGWKEFDERRRLKHQKADGFSSGWVCII